MADNINIKISNTKKTELEDVIEKRHGHKNLNMLETLKSGSHYDPQKFLNEQGQYETVEPGMTEVHWDEVKNKPNTFPPTLPIDANNITQDNTHRFVTDQQINEWSNHEQFDGDYNSLSNKPVNLSSFSNDTDYATHTEVDSLVLNSYTNSVQQAQWMVENQAQITNDFLLGEILNTGTDLRNLIANLEYINDVVYDNTNGDVTFNFNDGSSEKINIFIENLVQSLNYDVTTKEIVIIKKDYEEIRVDIRDLVDIYVGSLGEHIQVTVESGNIIKANLLQGSVAEEDLTVELQSTINNKANLDEIVPIYQGTENVGKIMGIDEEGFVVPVAPTSGPTGPVGPPGTSVIKANTEGEAISLSLANPNNIYFVV